MFQFSLVILRRYLLDCLDWTYQPQSCIISCNLNFNRRAVEPGLVEILVALYAWSRGNERRKINVEIPNHMHLSPSANLEAINATLPRHTTYNT